MADIERLKDAALLVAELADSKEVIAFGACGLKEVHMAASSFFETFDEYIEVKTSVKKYPYEYYAMVGDVRFFCLMEEKR